MDYTEMWKPVKAARDDLVAFAQRLIQTPSPSGQEGDLAKLIEAEMIRLDYDEVWVDRAGNVVGRLDGGAGPGLMMNGHMDHVDAGDPARWLHPPFGGEIHEGELWGRGAVDMKGALAAMVCAGGILKAMGTLPPGDRYVTAVVQEEVGGLGARYMAQTLSVDRVVVGEASENHLRRGHRGRVQLAVSLEGRSVHAATPHLGVNPHFSMARFVAGLGTLRMAADPAYGNSTVAPTRVASEPASNNVTPSALRLVLDWRNVPGEGNEEIVDRLAALLARTLEPGCQGQVEVTTKRLVSYNGFEMTYPDTFPALTTETDHPWLREARRTLAEALGRDVQVGTWRFATDGGHMAEAGATVIGFGPGDESVVHTVEERLSLDQLVESVVGYLALCMAE
jgi:putative selenium metabolism hydrolase